VGNEAKFVQQFSNLVIVITLIQAQLLGCVGGRVWPLDGDTLHGLSCHLAIMPMRAIHHHAEGHTMAIGEHAALGTGFYVIRGMLAHLFSPRGA
jgi:hypothetical protein